MAKPIVVILGAGQPLRGQSPPALFHTDRNRRVLDWIMAGFESVAGADFHFVSGYRSDEVVRNYPQMYYSINPNWQQTGSLASLLVAPLDPERSTYVCYADVVFRGSVVQRLHETCGDVVLAVDGAWRHRYEGRGEADMGIAEKVLLSGDRVTAISAALPAAEADAEFAGVMKLSARAVRETLRLRELASPEASRYGIPDLIAELQKCQVDVRAVDIRGDWAELNDPRDLARFVLGTKAETLERLRPLVRKSSIGDLVRFTVGEYQAHPHVVLDQIQSRFGPQSLVIRSSALAEDSWVSSRAGEYISKLGIAGMDRPAVAAAISTVIQSYGDDNPDHQVLVQAMVSGVELSGVVFTRTLAKGAGYYVINYDLNDRTETVTGGSGHELHTMFVQRSAVETAEDRMEARLVSVLAAVRELERLLEYDALDIEFARTRDGQMHVFQVRPLTIGDEMGPTIDGRLEEALRDAEGTFARCQTPGIGVVGNRTFFGIMPDWNPAEIIGTRPRRLALSLYQYLITDEVWAQQRAEFGYRDLRPHPLLVSFVGHPYVDIRAVCNSFIPAAVPDDLAARLVNYYLDYLKAHPHLHDKVEFDVIFTCLTCDFAQQSHRLAQAGFTPAEVECLRSTLLQVTSGALERYPRDLAEISTVADRFRRVVAAGFDPLTRACVLLDDARRWGTLTFAHLARGAFVATALLRSLERTGALGSEATAAFFSSLHTVASQFEADGAAVAAGDLAWEGFCERYGHLRPGTYEITCPTYAEAPEAYLRPIAKAQPVAPDYPAESKWSVTVRTSISRTLQASGLPGDVDALTGFLRGTLEGREYAKFVFTRNLSGALNALAEFGASLGVSREELSHIALNDLLALRSGSVPANLPAWLRQRADEGARSHGLAQAAELPPLILSSGDLYAFELPASQPNYVTLKRVIAPVVSVRTQPEGEDGLRGKVVLIDQADPGFDWLFGHGIAGLVTMYGGANSHMTIRAAEFGIPAAIGVGELLFANLAAADVIELDAAARLIRVIR